MGTRRKRRGRSPYGKPAVHAESHATSVSTSRQAYADTREWLLKEHGAVCAYCALTWPPRTMTLDHVTPRKGQTAYDRRDNLVLACKRCNGDKADKPFLAFLLANKSRARNLLRYGNHLSAGILEMLRPIAKNAPIPKRHMFGPDDEESPYKS